MLIKGRRSDSDHSKLPWFVHAQAKEEKLASSRFLKVDTFFFHDQNSHRWPYNADAFFL